VEFSPLLSYFFFPFLGENETRCSKLTGSVMKARFLALAVFGLGMVGSFSCQEALAFCETYEPCDDQEPDEERPGPDGPSRPDPEDRDYAPLQDPDTLKGW
jgi:hypothetical protein